MEKRINIILTIAIVVIIVASIVGGLMAFNKSPDLANSEFRVIVTDSMAGDPMDQYEIKTIPVDSLIAVHKIKGDDQINQLKVGDVIGFNMSGYNMPFFHRIVDIDETNRIIHTKGDNTTSGETVSYDDVTGKVVNVSPELGKVVTFVKDHIVLLICIVIAIFLVWWAISYYRNNEEK